MESHNELSAAHARSEHSSGDEHGALSQALRALSAADVESAIDESAAAAVPEFAEVAVLYVKGDGPPLLRALRHRDESKADLWRARLVHRPPRLDDEHGPGAVLRRREVERCNAASALPCGAEDGEEFALILPIGLGGEACAALTLLRRWPHFDDDDVELGQELARLVGITLERARLIESERRARTAAERIASRIERLQGANSELASAMSVERIAEVAVDYGVRAVAASRAALYLLRGDALHLVRSSGYVDDHSAAPELALSNVTPLSEAVRTGAPVLLGTRAEYTLAYSDGRRSHGTFDGEALACLPLSAAGARFGGLLFSFAQQQRFLHEDRAFLSLLANHCAQALLRARVLDQERRYHERIRLLADAGTLLTSSLDYDQTLANIVHLALPTLGDFCFLDVVEPSGEVRRIPDAYQDAETLAVLQKTRWVRNTRTDRNLCALSSGRTGVETDIDEAWMRDVATCPEQLEVMKRLRMCSMVTVPLLSQGELLGSLTLAYGASGRKHSSSDVALAEELGIRAAQAVRHARLYLSSQVATERAEQALREAEEASRLKDEFLATVSHELRTPLSAILGWATLLKCKDDVSSITKGLNVIERNARSQLRLVEDMLDVSRIVRGQLRLETEALELEPLARDVLESVRPAATAKEIELDFAVKDGPLRLVADPERLRQILWNLLSNGVKFTQPGGRVTLELEQSGGKVLLVVRDTGRGIEPRFLPHVFERFRQADGSTTRSSGGLGLGLAIVRHLSEMHGGSVQAESTGLGGGSTFTVTLPVQPFTQPLARRPPPPNHDPDSTRRIAAAGALAGTRVLIVEDEADARDLIQMLLASEGAVVKAASSAAEALDALGAFEPEVLVSDVGMPERDGYWLARQVHERKPALPMIALTAYTRHEDAERAHAAGFVHHVGKPVDPARLVEIVASTIQ